MRYELNNGANLVGDLEEKKLNGIINYCGERGPAGPAGPQGPQGPQGEPGVSVSVGTTTTGEPGTSASVTNTGTASDPILNFTIPRGATGATGPQGEIGPRGIQGEKGDKGDTGAQGPQGPAGAKGDKGDKGDTGATGAQGPKGDTGEPGEPGSQVSVSATGTSTNEVSYITIDSTEYKLAGGGGGGGEPAAYLKSATVNGNTLTLTNKDNTTVPYTPTVPTKTSDLTNDSGFIDKTVNDLTNYSDTSAMNTAISNHHDSTKQDTVSDLDTIRANATSGAGAATTISGYGNIVTHNTGEFATAAQGSKATTAVQPGDNITTLVNNAGYLTEHQSLANYSTTSEMNTAIAAHHDSTKYDASNPSGYTSVSVAASGSATDTVSYITIDGVEKKLAGGGSGEIAWGDITGTLANQTDLQTALNAKSTVSASTTGTATTQAKYLTINGIEWKLPTGGAATGDIVVTTNAAGATLNLIQNSEVVATHTLGAAETTYTFTGVEYGLYTVQVVHQYYITNTADVALASPSQSVSITCTPIGYITITTDQTEATLTCGSDTYTLTGSDLSHTFGPYQYNTFSVSAAKTGYVTATDTVVLDSPNESITLNLVAIPTGVIVVTSEVGATVTIGSDSYTYDTETHTFGPYQYGTYTVTATKGSQSKSVAVVLDSASVSVTVKPQLLPDGYTQLEYIESSRTQYIDTGIKPSQVNKIECKVKSSINNVAVLGCGTSATSEDRIQMYADNVNYSMRMDGSVQVSAVSSTSLATLILDKANKKGYVNGIEYSMDYSGSIGEYNIFLFARNISGSLSCMTGNIYYCKIYGTDNNLIRDFIPAQRISDNEIGMYDTVSNTFFTNAGTGTFTAGPVITTTTKINALSGLTATVTELNVLDGITATTTELNYTDGVTSNIQTQLNTKQATITSSTALTCKTLTGGITYVTTAPTAANTDGLKFAVLTSEPATRYDGWWYIITEA